MTLLEEWLLCCPNVAEAQQVSATVALVRPETLIGTTLALPGFDLDPRYEAIDRFTPWLDQQIKRGTVGGTVPKTYRLERQIIFCDTSVTLHLCLPPREWGIMISLLTSSGQMRRRLSTHRSRGGLLPDTWMVRDIGIIVRDDGSTVTAPTDRAFFEALGLPYVAPDRRT